MLDFAAVDCCCSLWARHPWPPAVLSRLCLCVFTSSLFDPCCHASTSSHTAPVHQLTAACSRASQGGQYSITNLMVPWQVLAVGKHNTIYRYSNQNQYFDSLYIEHKNHQDRGFFGLFWPIHYNIPGYQLLRSINISRKTGDGKKRTNLRPWNFGVFQIAEFPPIVTW